VLVLAASFVIYWVMARKKEGFVDAEPAVEFYHMDGSSQYSIYQESDTGERLPLPFKIEASDIASRFLATKAVNLKIIDLFYVEIYIDGKLNTTLRGTTKIYDGKGREVFVNGIIRPVLNGIWKEMYEVKNSFILINKVSLTGNNRGAKQIVNSMKMFTKQVNTKLKILNKFVKVKK
jgi:hypothetical protein